ncbi:MAG: DNA alkylation repair protein [Candidatus Dojkabacteria bacterium]|nr:DNA alkylation repair protein [Candidatus Dojkabacteria bacterium]MDQ7021419.1 DNA alkylation repair protein [Candidatus Dojkabacteria bacterium]
MRFFYKAFKGGYGEGDKFIGGLTVPLQRKIAEKYYKDLTLEDIAEMLNSKFHEIRFTATELLKFKYNSSKEITEKEKLVKFYLKNLDGINNWDIVDNSCYKILGDYLEKKNDISILLKLSESKIMWEQRIAMVSTMAFIRNNKLEPTYQLAEILVNHKHDLMHKAVGWLIREAGKRDISRLRNFLDKHYKTMPRTALRYAIEKMGKEERDKYLGRS